MVWYATPLVTGRKSDYQGDIGERNSYLGAFGVEAQLSRYRGIL